MMSLYYLNQLEKFVFGINIVISCSASQTVSVLTPKSDLKIKMKCDNINISEYIM